MPRGKKQSADKSRTAISGISSRLKDEQVTLTFVPNETERISASYIKRRIGEMQDFRRGLGIENRWKEADEQYIPHELDFGTTRKRFETDQDTGLRSRMVPVGDATQQWRQASSAPTLLAKIQTAVSIIVDQQPEANLVALLKKYEKTTEIAYALWKRNWAVTQAKEKLKLIIFDLIKYGWAAQKTAPRTVKYDKRILLSKDSENPENDKYEEKELTWFQDVDRQPLNVFRTWIDELTKPFDQYSMNECYYEMDYSYDAAATEFSQYPNWRFVKPDSQMVRNDERRKSNRNEPNTEYKLRKDVVTIGFFESRHKDLFGIYVPKDNIPLYLSPLPNDDGFLSLTHTFWLLRNSKLPYGISLWEIIRQNKSLYDKMKNMTMDQLVLSIMKFGFFSGTNTAIGDGRIDIVPGQARQLTSSTGKPEVNWMEIPGPGNEAWEGIEAIQRMMDDESGISPTMEGAITGKTLGEILHAKEAALKRLKVPVDNIAWLIEQDAYLTLSWMSQIYTIPIVKEFETVEAMQAFEQEEQMQHMENGLFGHTDADGGVTGPFQAHYLPQLALHLEDREGELFEGKESKFFQVGKDIKPYQLKWKGIFKVIPRSIVDSSQHLVKATKMEMFNILMPLFGQPPELVAKAAAQIIKVNEEDPKDWLPDAWLTFLERGSVPEGMPGQPQPPPGPQGPLFIPSDDQRRPTSRQQSQGEPMQARTMQNAAGLTPPSAQTVVPQGQVTGGPGLQQLGGGQAQNIFIKKV